MVRLTPNDSTDAILRFAADVAAQLNARHLIGVSAFRPVPIYSAPYTYLPQAPIARNHEWMERQLEAAGNRFHAILEAAGESLSRRSSRRVRNSRMAIRRHIPATGRLHG
jgi:hypothetical protein